MTGAHVSAGAATRVAVVEDDARYRASLATLFEHVPAFDLVESFDSAEDALARLDAYREAGDRPPWDLVLMDLGLPGMDGVACTRAVKERAPNLTVVVVTVLEDANVVLEAICAGADGYLAKHASPRVVVDELLSVVAGGAPLSAGVARTVLGLLCDRGSSRRTASDDDVLDLTERERAVLRCLVDGMAYKRVAAELDISIDTVRTHVRHVYSKLQVHSVAQAVSRAVRERLV